MNPDLFLAKLSFSTKVKTRILRQMQRLISAGISVSATLDMLYNLYSSDGKKPKNSTAIVINEWRKKHRLGRPLSDCFAGWIKPSEQLIIQAGEQSNRLPQAMMDALTASASGKKIRSTIVGSLAYPAIMLLALVGMLYGFSVKVLPTFSEIVDPATWTGNARRMYNLSEFVTAYFPTIGIFFIALSLFFYFSLPRLTGPARIFLDKIPPYSIYKVTEGASFMMSLRGFISAGVAVPEALRRIGRIGTPYMKSRTKGILSQVNLGRNLGDAMKRAGHNFPDPDINGEISIYAGLDGFDENLDMLAKEWIEGAVEKAQQTSKIIGNVVIVLMGCTIGFMALSMFELNDLIGRSTGI
jgi:type II secretory pathway component PulF